MTILPKIDIAEATRLTRAGRLTEALAVLRGKAPDPQPAGDAETRLSLALPSPHHPAPSNLAQLSSAIEAPTGRLAGLVKTFEGLPGLVRERPAPPLPGGARFEERQFAGPTGARAYKLYVPSGYRGQPVPLVVMLHGCTQSPDDFATGTRMNAVAESETVLVAYPAQDAAANTSRCWNWFRAGDQRRDGGEPAIVAGITRQIMRDFAVEPGHVYVAGLSAGGAMAAVLGQAYPDLYAAVGVHSGLACGAARDMPSAFAAMRQGGPPAQAAHAVPTIVFHGDRDTIVNPVNGDLVMAQATAAGLRTTVERGGSPAAAFTRTIHRDARGGVVAEHWVLHGAGHAWSGGSPAGSFTEPRGPDASRAMMDFFLQHTTAAAQAT